MRLPAEVEVINDINGELVRLYRDTVPITYAVGSGSRAVDRFKLIIYSWDRLAEPTGLF